MQRLRSLLSWLGFRRYLRRYEHNVSVPPRVELPDIDQPSAAPSQPDDEREHYQHVITENDRRLAMLRAKVNAQLHRGER